MILTVNRDYFPKQLIFVIKTNLLYGTRTEMSFMLQEANTDCK
jgi:hypothetical protein